MEALLDEMEKDINKQREEEAKTPEEKLFDELLENEEVQKIYKKIKEGKMNEISEITGVSLNAATVNLSRARQKIREQIMMENQKVDEKIWKI